MGIANIINNSTTTSGGEIIRELVNSSDGQGLHFDGAAGNIAGTTGLNLGSKYSAEFVLNYSGQSQSRLFDISGGGRVIIEFNRTGYTGKIVGYDSGWYEIADLFENDTTVHFVVTFDGTSVTAYVNGNQVGTATKNNSTEVTSSQFAVGSSIPVHGSWFNGTIYRARFYNKALTSAEVQTAFERADIDFSSQYGSQSELVTNGDFASSSGWSVQSVGGFAGSTTWTDDGSTLQFIRRADWTITKGKKYRLQFTVSSFSGAGSLGLFDYSRANRIADNVSVSANGTVTAEFTAQNSSSSGALLGTADAANNIAAVIDDLSCVQIGAVSDYDLAFANENQSRMVADRSTNNVDGEMSSSGVKQTQVIKQLNSTAMRVGGTSATAATPADGQVIGDKITTTDAIQLERVSQYTAKLSCVDSGGNQTLQILGNRSAGSASSGTDVLIGGEQSRTTGNVLKVEQGSDTYLTINSTGLATFSNGIAFQSATTGSGTGVGYTLDSYETGTWTPTVGGTWTSNPTSLTGTYTKVGNLVRIGLKFSSGTKASITAGYIDGLPFTVDQFGTGSVTDSSVTDKGNALCANGDRVWLTNNTFGASTYVTATYTVA